MVASWVITRRFGANRLSHGASDLPVYLEFNPKRHFFLVLLDIKYIFADYLYILHEAKCLFEKQMEVSPDNGQTDLIV